MWELSGTPGKVMVHCYDLFSVPPTEVLAHAFAIANERNLLLSSRKNENGL